MPPARPRMASSLRRRSRTPSPDAYLNGRPVSTDEMREALERIPLVSSLTPGQRRERMRLQVLMADRAPADTVTYVTHLVGDREMVACGDCVLEDVYQTGPLAPGFCLPLERIARIGARRAAFLAALDARWPAVPPHRRRVLCFEWSLNGGEPACCRPPENARSSVSAALLEPWRGYRPSRLRLGSMDIHIGASLLHPDGVEKEEEGCAAGGTPPPSRRRVVPAATWMASCPCLAVRGFPGGLRDRGTAAAPGLLHGVYVDVWPEMRPAAGRLLAALRADGRLDDQRTVLCLNALV